MNAGAAAALATAFSWTVTALAFEYAGKRIGAFALNFLRLAIGFVLLGLWCLGTQGYFLPVGAGTAAWTWLSASGLVGLVVGDLMLFQAFIDLGSRVAMLIYASAPALTALLGFALLGERLGAAALAGMALTMAGIALVVLSKSAGSGGGRAQAAEGLSYAGGGRGARTGDERRVRLRGLLLAVGASLGQAAGLILSKIGAGGMDPFAGTLIRVAAGLAGFALVLAATGAWRGTLLALKDRRALAGLGIGSFFGPFLGVSLSLLAVQRTEAGVAAAIMSIVPILIIPPAALLNKERIGVRDLLGSAAAVAGVVLLFVA